MYQPPMCTLFLTRKNCIELRNISDGRIVCQRDVNFLCAHVCSTGDAILVVNWKTKPVKPVRFLIKLDPDLNIEQINKTIDTQLTHPFGPCCSESLKRNSC